MLSENQLPGESDHLVMIYDELILAGDDDGIVDLSFNGNLMKFQALATMLKQVLLVYLLQNTWVKVLE